MARVRSLKRQVYSDISVIAAPKADESVLKALTLPDFQINIKDDLLTSILAGEVFTLSGNREDILNYLVGCKGKFFSDAEVPDYPDIRMVWEAARLQHITALLFAAKSDTNIDQLRDFAKKALLDWINDNPFLTGPHYMSAMECGLRIPVFVYALKLLNNISENEISLLSRAIYEHAWWVSNRLSLYSSLGNHTVCECLGLLFAGALFKGNAEGKAWISSGIQLLDQEVSHQILDDGGPAEQSLSYHRFLLDLYWLASDFLNKNSLYDCTRWRPRLIVAEEFLEAFKSASGQSVSIGDSDDGLAIAPGIVPARISFHKNQRFCTTYKNSGYSVFHLDNDSILTFDHGPLGMAPLYNHGHADALSMTVSVKGRPIFIDPGTYRYNGVPELRKYFKGTRAHNTVTLDGLDQAVQETGFIWSHPYNSDLTRSDISENRIFLEAKHDGYMRLDSPVMHSRSVTVLDKAQVLITDTFSGKGTHDFELNFHLHPECIITKVDDWWRIQREDAIVFLKVIGDSDFVLISGEDSPPFGWYSDRYGVKEKSFVLCCRRRGMAAEVKFKSVISINEKNFRR